MTWGVLVLWIISALVIVPERRTYRLIIYFCIFSLITSAAYFLLGSPDVAMAEAAIGVFSTIFFIIYAEKYYGLRENIERDRVRKRFSAKGLIKPFMALLLCAGAFALAVNFIPQAGMDDYLKREYLTRFMTDVGGENAVTAIYLGYRVYDTLFEALILVIAVVAVTHLSYFEQNQASGTSPNEMTTSKIAVLSVRIISPILLAFGVYLILNGHITAGGGFQGGLVLAAFFICRYMVYRIDDIPIGSVIRMEEYFYIGITVITIIVVFLGVAAYVPAALVLFYQNAYLISMNILIGLKVAGGFFALFYRFVSVERR
ncbi:MAG: DUF4040 domain-containing protein [Defluviitaleaceae bacterium]|nr:DUF4040 domain-containing protein [Defluviitaleaceae bacterium]